MSRYVNRARAITALLLLIAGIVTLWASRDLPFGTINRMKAGFFPTVFGTLLTVLSLLLLVQVFRNRNRNNAASNDPEEGEEPLNLRRAFAFVGIFILFVAATMFLGFLSASFLSLVAAGYLMGLKGWRLIVLSAGTTVVVWFIFDYWLGLSLPVGVFI